MRRRWYRKPPEQQLLESIRENSILSACLEYLEYHQNMGQLLYLRLNSGDVFASGRRIKLCPEGTADIFILCWGRAIFVETKRPVGGVMTGEQIRFQADVQAQGGAYLVVTDLEEMRGYVEGILKPKGGRER